MLTQAPANATDCAVALLTHYSFDLSGYTARELVDRWLNGYPANWIHLAVIEALYQGRYKAISVDQILAFWQRRNLAIYHFNYDFERLICGENMPQKPHWKADTQANSLSVPKAAVRFKGKRDSSKVERTKKKSVYVDNQIKVPPATDNRETQVLPSKSNQTSINELPGRSLSNARQPSIQQFNPEKTDTSELYCKLKAIAHSDDYTLVKGKAKESEYE